MEHPTGLRNVGNSCFLNSCLQCLGSMDCLNSYFLKKNLAYNPHSKRHGFICVLLTRFILSLHNGENFDPSDFLVSIHGITARCHHCICGYLLMMNVLVKESFCYFWPDYKPGVQMDAHLCVGNVLQWLHEDLTVSNNAIDVYFQLSYVTIVTSEFTAFQGCDSIVIPCNDAMWALWVIASNSIVRQIFHVLLQFTFTCRSCSFTWCHTDEPECGLILPLPEGKSTSFDLKVSMLNFICICCNMIACS